MIVDAEAPVSTSICNSTLLTLSVAVIGWDNPPDVAKSVYHQTRSGLSLPQAACLRAVVVVRSWVLVYDNPAVASFLNASTYCGTPWQYVLSCHSCGSQRL